MSQQAQENQAQIKDILAGRTLAQRIEDVSSIQEAISVMQTKEESSKKVFISDVKPFIVDLEKEFYKTENHEEFVVEDNPNRFLTARFMVTLSQATSFDEEPTVHVGWNLIKIPGKNYCVTKNNFVKKYSEFVIADLEAAIKDKPPTMS